jgi:hypothetical protein
MKRTTVIFSLALSVFATVVLVGQQIRTYKPMPPEIVIPEPVRDVVHIAPKHYRLEFENERVRVLRATFGPDDVIPMHDDPAAVLVCVSECHVRFTRPDGKVQDVHMEAGQSRWIWEDTRSEKNLSTHPVEMLFIEMKRKSSK